MLKNYNDNDKKIAIKLKKLLKNNYKPVENVDDTNLNSTQTDSNSDFLALRIIDNLIRFNQSFRLSQVPIKANMGKYNKKKKGSGVTFVGGVFTKEELDNRDINYKTEQPTNSDGNINRTYKKHGDVWIHNNTLKSLIAKDKKTISDDAVDYILDSVYNKVDKRAKITNDAKKKLEQNLEKTVDKKTISDDAVDYILDSVDSNIDKREKAINKIKNAMLNKIAKMKRLTDENDDDKLTQKELDETSSIYESLAPKKKGNVKDLIDMYNSGQIKNEELNEKLNEELEELDNKQLEDLLNQFDGDNKFPSSFESLLSAYSLMENINRNYRDLRPIFNNLSVPVFNDLNDVLNETDELIKKSVKTFHLGRVSHMQKTISYNIDDYRDKFNKIVSTFDNIYNDFQQRKQTFNTNIKTGSGFGYLSKIRNI